jgi:hypothetical protein
MVAAGRHEVLDSRTASRGPAVSAARVQGFSWLPYHQLCFFSSILLPSFPFMMAEFIAGSPARGHHSYGDGFQASSTADDSQRWAFLYESGSPTTPSARRSVNRHRSLSSRGSRHASSAQHPVPEQMVYAGSPHIGTPPSQRHHRPLPRNRERSCDSMLGA